VAATRFTAEHTPLNLMIASPALRALQTAQLFASAIRYPAQDLRTDPRLYLASPANIKTVIRETDDSILHLAIVGHNPGISEFASEISADPDLAPLGTCGVVTVQLDCDSWFDDRFLNW
jgi:phosphohistidine phosphatase